MKDRYLASIVTLFAAGCWPWPAAAAEQSRPYDALIRHGTLIDGSGKPGVLADIAIADGRVIAVGQLKSVTAKEVIDATGKVVCPGFIDLHSHADRGILEFRPAENYMRQGLTTLLCGNCGSSPTNVGDSQNADGGTGPNIALLIGARSRSMTCSIWTSCRRGVSTSAMAAVIFRKEPAEQLA